MTAPRPAAGAALADQSAAPPWHLGVDVGGTFTDVVVSDANGEIFSFKSLSQPDDPAAGVRAALELAARSLGLSIGRLVSGCALFVHGSTVATNTLLEHSGAKVGLLVTEGFRDSLEIRRGYRENPWDHRTPYPPVLVPRFLRLPVRERIDRHGRVHTSLDEQTAVEAMRTFAAEGVESVAICFLNSFLNPVHEQRVAELVKEMAPELWVSVSSSLIPVAGEYDRLSTTVVDAYVAPRLISYLRALDAELKELGLGPPLLLVKNNGGTAAVEEVIREPIVQTLSGPASAVGALRYYSGPLATSELISVEVGGTSCDVVLMDGGEVAVTDRLSIGDYDTVVPSVEIHSVGTGGGSIAGVDKAGVLFVGPRGAGARPGPACYGLGGNEPTVTDAQLVLGRLRSGRYAGGALSLDGALADRAVTDKVASPLGLTAIDAAAGIVRVAEQRILHAVNLISVERGLDPRRFVLVAGGGAGGLHGAAVGRMLGCHKVCVPRLAGVLCALGMLNSDVRHDYVRAFRRPLQDADAREIDELFARMIDEARAALRREGFGENDTRFEREFDLCYHDQQWDIRVRLADGALHLPSVRRDFEDQYDRLYGHRQPETAVEIVKLRLTGFGAIQPPATAIYASATAEPVPVEHRPVYADEEWKARDMPIYSGRDLKPGHRVPGPLVVEEETTTVFVGPHDRLEIDAAGNYLIVLGEREADHDT